MFLRLSKDERVPKKRSPLVERKKKVCKKKKEKEKKVNSCQGPPQTANCDSVQFEQWRLFFFHFFLLYVIFFQGLTLTQLCVGVWRSGHASLKALTCCGYWCESLVVDVAIQGSQRIFGNSIEILEQ